LLDTTPIWTIIGRGAGQSSHQRHRERISHLFDHLADVADDPEPKFCLAYILVPHPPFVFGREGENVSEGGTKDRLTDGKPLSDLEGHGGPDDHARQYREQVTSVSTRVEQLVGQIS